MPVSQAPGGQLRSVAAVWHQLQLSLALEVCRFWLTGAEAGQDVAGSVAGLLEVARLPHHAGRLAELGRGAAVVEALSSFMRATAAVGVDPAWATLAKCLDAALASGAEVELPAYAAVEISVTEALAAACPALPSVPSPPTAMALLAELEPPTITPPAAAAPASADEVDPGASTAAAYRRLCTWLGLLAAHLAEGSSPAPDLLLDLVGRLTRAAHYLLAGAGGPGGGPEERAGILVASLLHVVRLLPERKLAAAQERLLRPQAGSAAGWLPVLGCWLADVAAIRDLTPDSGWEGAPPALRAAWQAPAAAGGPSDLAAEEALMLHEAAVQAGDTPHAVAMWLEFGLRLRHHKAALQPLFGRDELLGQLSSVGQRYYREGSPLTAALTRVAAVVGGEAGGEGDGLALPLEDAAVAQELASFDQPWLRAVQELQVSVPIQSIAPEPALATLPAPRPPVDNSFLGMLQARQAQQAEALEEAAALLKLWGRRQAVKICVWGFRVQG